MLTAVHLLQCVLCHYGSERAVVSHSEAGFNQGVILQLLAGFDKD